MLTRTQYENFGKADMLNGFKKLFSDNHQKISGMLSSDILNSNADVEQKNFFRWVRIIYQVINNSFVQGEDLKTILDDMHQLGIYKNECEDIESQIKELNILRLSSSNEEQKAYQDKSKEIQCSILTTIKLLNTHFLCCFDSLLNFQQNNNTRMLNKIQNSGVLKTIEGRIGEISALLEFKPHGADIINNAFPPTSSEDDISFV